MTENEISDLPGIYGSHIKYLQRAELDEQKHDMRLGLLEKEARAALSTTVDIGTSLKLWMVEVEGISRYSPSGSQQASDPSEQIYRSLDLLSGLNGQQIPIFFLLRGEKNNVRLIIGTPEYEKGPAIRTILNSQYPGIELLPSKDDPDGPNLEKESALRSFIHQCPHVGLVTGIPTPKTGGSDGISTQIDRLIRGLYGSEWAFLVLASHEEDKTFIEMQLATLNEFNRVNQEISIRDWRESSGQNVASYYCQLLDFQNQFLESCLAEGGWWVQSYICTKDQATYLQAQALIKSIFSGTNARIDRIRTIDFPGGAPKVASFSPVLAERSGGHPLALKSVNRRNKYRTLLSSGQLSAMIHLPRRETPGYFVKESAIFDVSPHVPAKEVSIEIGEILDQGSPTGNQYRVPLKELTRHGLVVGITGSGKTTTIFHLLKQLMESETPVRFLVIEPVKREYWEMAELIGPDRKLRIITVGEEGDGKVPLRLNPFEIPNPVKNRSVSVQTHIDLLKSVFNASFGMWTPLPQVLERAIHEIYRDKGWDPIHNTNDRARMETPEGTVWHPWSQPTLTDLFNKVSEIVPKLGYDREVTRNVKTALETRINSLRVGAKGLMLDTPQSFPVEELLKEPTILELEGVGDDEEKAFLMGLILMNVYEYYRSEGTQSKALKHITVVEEAHRLLTNVPLKTDPEAGNLKGKAVDVFVGMLSEIRAYGEGFIIAEQIPTKLAPDVIKNTALKIVHRTVANDDRVAMGGAMNLSDPQIRQLVSLQPGHVIIHGGGKFSDDNAIYAGVPNLKGESGKTRRNVDMKGIWRELNENDAVRALFSTYPTCDTQCESHNLQCSNMRVIAEEKAVSDTVSAMILSFVTQSDFIIEGKLHELLERLYNLRVTEAIRPYRRSLEESPENTLCILTHAIHRHLMQRAGEYGWNYIEAERLMAGLLPGIASLVRTGECRADCEPQLLAFCKGYQERCAVMDLPFYGCDKVCNGVCLYRYAVRPFAHDEIMMGGFRNAVKEDDQEEELKKLWGPAGDSILYYTHDKFLNEALCCFVIQSAALLGEWRLEKRHSLVDDVVLKYIPVTGGEDG